jgi:hypothetical protein
VNLIATRLHQRLETQNQKILEALKLSLTAVMTTTVRMSMKTIPTPRKAWRLTMRRVFTVTAVLKETLAQRWSNANENENARVTIPM